MLLFSCCHLFSEWPEYPLHKGLGYQDPPGQGKFWPFPEQVLHQPKNIIMLIINIYGFGGNRRKDVLQID